MGQLSKVSRILWIAFAALFAVRIFFYLLVLITDSFSVLTVMSTIADLTLFLLFGGLLTWFIFFLIQTGGPKSREWLPALLGVAGSGMLTLTAFASMISGNLSSVGYVVWFTLNVMVLMAAFILLGIFFKEKIQKWVSFIAAGAIPFYFLFLVFFAFLFAKMGAYSLMVVPGLFADIFLFAPFFLFVYVFDANKPKALPKF